MVKRVFVEKKQGFDAEAQGLGRELREKLGLTGLGRVRIVDRYDVDGITEELFERAVVSVFCDGDKDEVLGSELLGADGAFVFGMEYLPGQFDQRADSAELCIRLLAAEDSSGDEGAASVNSPHPTVRTAKYIIIESDLTAVDKARIKKYIINPVDTREVSVGAVGGDHPEAEAPPITIPTISDFRTMDTPALQALAADMNFAMSEDDLRFVQSYFGDEGREPTVTELRAIDTYWSDHCRHTTFNTHLTDISFGEGAFPALVKEAFDEYMTLRHEVYGDEAPLSRPITLMDVATIGAKAMKRRGLLPDLDESEEVNACSIKVKAEIIPEPDAAPATEDWLVMFKNETHNHPTEIEPLGGASTCLGGAIRDPLSGRAYVYQAMRITGSADPRTPIEDTLPGKLPQYQITRTAAKGYSSYGNQIGVAAGFLDEIYDESYVAKRMELGAVIAAAPAANVVRKEPVTGDVILMVGGRTGRDGVGGATGSSKEQTEESVQKAGAEVQKGNPPLERNIQRLFRRGEAARLIKRCNDFGAGGISVAIGELAPSIDVNLDKVPTKYDGMDGTDLALSESQERMAVVIAAENAAEFIAYAAEENLETAQVAEVTDTGRFRIYWRGEAILDLARDFLDSNGVPQKRTAVVCGRMFDNNNLAIGTSGQGASCVSLADLNVASLRGLAEQFDSTAGAYTLLMPLGGVNQLTPALGMAAKLPIISGDTNTSSLMAYGYDPEIAKTSPFHSAMYAVLDSYTKICAMGGDPERIWLSFQEYFPKLGSDPERWGLPLMALLGALKAQMALDAPAIGGKDSMSGTFHDIDVVPTLVSFATCAADARHTTSPEFKRSGSHIALLECPRDEKSVPDFEAAKRNMKRVHELICEGKILAASTIPQGGVFAAVAKMAFGNGIGAEIYAGECGQATEAAVCPPSALTSEAYGSLLLEIDSADDPEALFTGLACRIIGKTNDSGSLTIGTVTTPLADLLEIWEAPLAEVFPTVSASEGIILSGGDFFAGQGAPSVGDGAYSNVREEAHARSNAEMRKKNAAKPTAFIPILPGTHGDTDARRAFERAGADVRTHTLLTTDPAALKTSIKQLADEIKNAQILVLPGGITGGDVDGSARLTTIIMQNPYVAEALAELIENKDGLILGVGSGFRTLLNLGLLPYGKIGNAPVTPTITLASLPHHVSRIARVRVASTLSPWLANAQVGDIHSLPISTNEGCITADPAILEALATSGQIATQYAEATETSTRLATNAPAPQTAAIEGLTSPDGRIFGRIGHPERNAPGLYMNVPGDYDDGIFASAVAYFR